MKFRVQYSGEALRDLQGIYEYIAYVLQAPDTAAAQHHRITESIRKLEVLPMRYPKYTEEPWLSKGMRWLPVDNYIVFYFMDEKLKTVSVARIMYMGRDVKGQLGKG